MSIRTRQVTTNVDFLVVDGIEIPLAMVEALCECDGFMEVVSISPRSFAKELEAAGLIRTNIRGGSYATEKLKTALNRKGVK